MTQEHATQETGHARRRRDLPTTVRLTHEMRGRLRAIAHAQGRSFGELLRLLIERGAPYADALPPKDTAGLLHPPIGRQQPPAA